MTVPGNWWKRLLGPEHSSIAMPSLDPSALLIVLLPGRRSLHIQKHTCSSSGYPAAKIRQCMHLLHPTSFLTMTPHQSPYSHPLSRGYSTIISNPYTTDNWGMKAKRRKTTGTGRMRSMKEVPRKFKNGFQTGAPKGARGTPTKDEVAAIAMCAQSNERSFQSPYRPCRQGCHELHAFGLSSWSKLVRINTQDRLRRDVHGRPSYMPILLF